MPSGNWTQVRDLAGGRAVKMLDRDGNTLRFFADRVPAGGYTTFLPLAAKTAASQKTGAAHVIENSFFRLEADPARGGIVSLVDLKTGRELASGADEHGFGAYWQVVDHAKLAKRVINIVAGANSKRSRPWC